LTEEAVKGYNTNAKMNPPLRTPKDRTAIIEALRDGTIDAIATDHAPHSVLEKDIEFDQAANGIIGLETAVPLTMALFRKGHIDAARLVELLSSNPARILRVNGGSLGIGAAADIAVIDPELQYILEEQDIRSKSRNSPFIGSQLQGKAVLTLCGGRITHNLLSF
jgi:dihydroorotase